MAERAGPARGPAWVPVGVALAGLLLALLLPRWPGLARLDDLLADAAWRWLAPPAPPPAALVLDIDEASLRALAPAFGPWPLRRDAYALVIDYLREAGARAVVVDVVMADGREGDGALQRSLRAGGDGMPVLLAAAALPAAVPLGAGAAPAAPAPAAGAAAEAPATAWPGWLLPAPGLREAARLGVVSMPLEADGLLRRLPLLHEAAGQRLAAMPLALQQALQPGATLAWQPAPPQFSLAGQRWPADGAGRLRLPPPTAQGLAHLPFHAVAAAALGQPAPAGLRAQLQGRLVFVGSSAGLGNRVMTPAGQLSGTEWLALAHDALAAGRVIAPPPPGSVPLLAALALLPSLWLWRRGRPQLPRDALLSLAMAGLLLAGGAAALVLARQQLPAVLPLGMLAAGLLLAVAAQQRHARLAAEQLRYERAVAEAANAAKSEFLASMSHELRTPLNGVIGACQLLQDHGGDDQRREELLDIIRASSNHLLGLIDGVLHLARIEAGVMELVDEQFNLVDAIEAVLATAAAPARAKGLQMACVIDPALPAWRVGDVTRLRQVLLNLMGNAVKFTAEGEVVLRIGPGPGPADLRFVVRDTGIGLDPAAQQRVFEPFAQADSGTTRRYGGSGLGLTISRKLVQAMGGRIELQSQPGQGASFSVHLALPLAEAPPTEVPPLGYRVAFVEPHEASAEGLAALLQRMGCQPLHCRTPEALHAACTWPDAQGRPAWLLVATDAPQALDLLDAAVDWVDPGRVIGMSRLAWYAAEHARERVHLPRSVLKPVLRSALVSRFGALAEPVAGDTAPGELGPPQLRQVGRVLIVEDDPVNQTIVSAMLGQAGFHTELAADGGQALRRCADTRFDVVLMDWQMPDMDGIEVTRRLRAGEAGETARQVPVVALTANAFAEDRAACLAAGMNDFLSKPVVAEDLVAVVSRWMRRG